MRGFTRRMAAGASVALMASTILLTNTSAATARTATPGAPGVGDTLFPTLGNGGYDAIQYTLDQRYPTPTPSPDVAQRQRMDARATQNLSSFNLDYAGTSVGAVLVNGQRATVDWRLDRPKNTGELVITPAKPIKKGSLFSVVVDFVSGPVAPELGDPYPDAWVAAEYSSFTSFQPNLAHTAIPVNDHPSDKARWRFRIDVPVGVTAVTNGVKRSERTTGDRTLWVYEETSPLASELLQIAVGTDLDIVDRGSVNGVQYRDVIAQGPRDLFEPGFVNGPAQLKWVMDRIGEYPHEVYGNLGVDVDMGYALETQGLSLHSRALFNPEYLPGRSGQPWFFNSVMIHEEAHEWYGNSVSPAMWSDLWLNEGWATYFMKVWEQDQGTIDEWGNPSIVDYMKETYSQGDIWRAEFGPVARPKSAETLFGPNVYDGGALVLFALKQKVGDEKFNAILTGWPKRHKDTSQGTDAFIKFASKTACQDLSGFLGAYLYGDTTPSMPGYPDWETAPVTAAAKAAARDLAASEDSHAHHAHHFELAG